MFSFFEMRILRMGKSINFICVCCEDSGSAEVTVEAAAPVGAATRRGGLGFGEIDALEALTVEAAKQIDRHMMDVIHKRYKFKDHCLAIKRYLLLGHGDFVQYLMDIIDPELLKVRMMDHGDGETELNDNYNVGIEDISIEGVQMIDVQSTEKAYPTEGWNHNFGGP
ncbi:hypothetical protein MA16_Dca011573 [Dendrobium catenatum]|uniref:Gamma tubulin complex component C-terminal domain-containing protein n=1 Tax=Dendrobium catenatum TaxID=906689 RepID=A0A2I0WQK8_9ASPA|nr:hypothetical protein MA16_Dca011573 [Dendrobium catenatum]